jgi:hypothetical protein
MTITIGGSTAQAWVDSGTAQGVNVTLIADPAGSAPVTFDGTNGNIFDATDRDGLVSGGPFGIGVLNTTINNGDPGVTSVPSEIGFYGNTPLSYFPDGSQQDILDVQFNKDMTGGSVTVSFFYAGEAGNPEALQYQLLDNGVVVDTETITSSGNGAYSSSNPGFFTFNLDSGIKFDEIKFLGDDAHVADATDFLVESITTDLYVPPVVCYDGNSQGYWAQHSNLWDTVAHGGVAGDLTTSKYDTVFNINAFGAAVGDKTLLQVEQTNGGGEAALGRQVVAALENAVAGSSHGLTEAFRFSPSDIIKAVQEVYGGAGGHTFDAVKGADLQNLLEFWNTVPEKSPGGELCSNTTVLNPLDYGTLHGGSFTGDIIGVLQNLHPDHAWV